MANLHKDFLFFNNSLNITNGKLAQLKTSEANIKRYIKSYLTKKNVPVPTLIRQGSFALGTSGGSNREGVGRLSILNPNR